MSGITRILAGALLILGTNAGLQAASYHFEDTRYGSSPDYEYRLIVWTMDSNWQFEKVEERNYTYRGSTGQTPPSPYLYYWDVDLSFSPGTPPALVFGNVEYRVSGTGTWYSEETIFPTVVP
jgi:hypothetical protein